MIGFFLSACTPTVDPIRFGKEECHHCKMIISDVRFGAELVTDKGKVFKFDAIECMIDYLKKSENQIYAFTQAIGYDTPGVLHPVAQLYFLISHDLPSPMGANLSAFTDRSFTQDLPMEITGEFYDWDELEGFIHQIK